MCVVLYRHPLSAERTWLEPQIEQIADDLVVDPWFNFRATKHLVEHGFYSFWDWFDDRMFRAVWL
jgi:hypothetical protein